MGHAAEPTIPAPPASSPRFRPVAGLCSVFRISADAAGLGRCWQSLGHCMLVCVCLSYLRYPFVASLKVDGTIIDFHTDPYLRSFAGLALLISVYYHWRSVELAHWGSWRNLWRGALLLHLIAFLCLPLTSNDIFSNLAYGRMASLGIDPFTLLPSDLPASDIYRIHVGAWTEAPCVYGPVVLLLAQLSLGSSMALAVWKFKAFMALATGLAMALAYNYCRSLPADQGKQRFVMLAWHPLVLWELTSQAHNDATLVLGLTLAVWAMARERWNWATVGLVLASLTKIVIVPLLGLYFFWLFRASPRRAVGQGLLYLGLCALGYYPYWHGISAFYPTLLASTQLDKAAHSLGLALLTMLSYFSVAHPAEALMPVLVIVKLILLVIAARLADRVRSGQDVVEGALYFMLLMLCLATPWFMPWYGTWLLPMAMGCPSRPLRMTVYVYALAVLEVYLPSCLGTGWFVFALHLVPVIWLMESGEAARLFRVGGGAVKTG